MGGEIDLVLTVDEARSLVKVDTASIIHVIGARLSLRHIQPTLGVAHKMIDRHALTGKEVVFLEHTITIIVSQEMDAASAFQTGKWHTLVGELSYKPPCAACGSFDSGLAHPSS